MSLELEGNNITGIVVVMLLFIKFFYKICSEKNNNECGLN